MFSSVEMRHRVPCVLGEGGRVFGKTTTMTSEVLGQHPKGAENMSASNSYNQLKSERRKVRKVLVERKRRERIDRCLDQLKVFLQDAALPAKSNHQNSQVDPTASLEKADILELTVNHLRALRARQRVSGYNACAREVDSFLAQTRYDERVRQRMMFFLASRQAQLMHTASGVAQVAGEDEEGEDLPTKESDPRFAASAMEAANQTRSVDNRSRSADLFTNNTFAANYVCPSRGPLPAVNDPMLAGAQHMVTAAFDYTAEDAANNKRQMMSSFVTSLTQPLTAADQYAHLSMCSGVGVPCTQLTTNTLYRSMSRSGSESCRPQGRASTSFLRTSSPVFTIGLTSSARKDDDDFYSGNNNNSIQSSDIDTTSLMTSTDDVTMTSSLTSPEDVVVTSQVSTRRAEESSMGLKRRIVAEYKDDGNQAKGCWSEQQTSSSFGKGFTERSRADSGRWSENESINIASETDCLKKEPVESEMVWRPW